MRSKFIKSVAAGVLAVGLGAILAQAGPPPTPQGVITAKVFLTIGGGTAVTDLTGNAKFPNSPDLVQYPTYFQLYATGDINTQAPNDVYNDSGAQMVGYFYPDTTGDYTFWVSADDGAALYLSTDETAANKKLIAQESTWSNVRSYTARGDGGAVEEKCSLTFAGTQWPTKDPSNGGAKITLTAGKIYYIEAVEKEGSGGDNLSVSIDGTLPIPGSMLSSFDKNTGPVTIATQPQSVTLVEGQSASFSVGADGTPPYTYQWQRGGADITGETNSTLTLSRVVAADNNATFTCKVSNASSSATSQPATLTVSSDTVAPTVARASTDVTFTKIALTYSEPVSDTATKLSNYALDQGLTISAVTRIDAQTVTLTTSKMVEGGTTYNLTINGVQDTAAVPNTIAANTKVQVRTLVYVAGRVVHQKYNGFSDADGWPTPDNMFNDPRYPAAPDRRDILTTYEYPANGVGRDSTADPARNYFDTIDGFFIPPTTDNYVFLISFADRCWVYLSTDETPASKHLIIGLDGWSDPRYWLTSHDYDTTQNRSDSASNTEWPDGNTIHLEAGKKYYMQMVHHDPSWSGGDWFSATYKLDSQPDPADGSAPLMTGQVIGTYIDPSGITLAITQQPQSASILENETVKFTVSITTSWNTPVYQWQKAPPGGAYADIPGATQNNYTTPPLLVADSGSRYRVNVTVPGTTIASDDATITVTSDKAPPTLVTARRNFAEDTKVTVVFSELLDAASAGSLANYQINNGIMVSAAALAADGKSVVLTTLPIARGTSNTLTVSGVKDKAGNAITASSQIAIGFQRGALFVMSSGSPPTLNASDGLIQSRLESQGYYVEAVGADVDDVSMATGKDLIVLSSTFTSGNVADTYKNSPVPIVLWENAIQDDMAMTTVGGTADRGTTTGQTQIEIVNPSHPMAAGLPAGPVTVVTAAAEFVWGQPNTNAQVVARIAGTTDHATIYGYDKGAKLLDGTTAAERRVTFLMTDNVAAVLNDTGWRLFDAAVNWAQNLAVSQPPPQITNISVSNGTVSLQWINGGTLKSTPSLTAPITWTDEPGNGSYTGPATGAAKFFRVVR